MENDLLHVLLADDDETDRLIFKEAFEELKIKTIVHAVNNGEQLIGTVADPRIIFCCGFKGKCGVYW